MGEAAGCTASPACSTVASHCVAANLRCVLRRVEYDFINKSSLFKLIGHPLVVKSSSYTRIDVVFLVRSVLPNASGSPNLSTDFKVYDWKDSGFLS